MKCADCDHEAHYLGWNEEDGDYDLCECCYRDLAPDEACDGLRFHEAFPDMEPEIREVLMTGTHPD